MVDSLWLIACKMFKIAGIFLIILLFSFSHALALTLDKAKGYFISGDYKQTIIEAENVLSKAEHNKDSDELYYLLGLSYLKEGNYPRAADNFEIILKNSKDSVFKNDALLGLGDTFLLRKDYAAAEGIYKELINNSMLDKIRPLLYYRLSQCALAEGKTQPAKDYLDNLKQNFPLSLELQSAKDIVSLTEILYAVQVGSFSSTENARKLAQKLMNKNYPAYIEEANAQGGPVYRVRIGKFRTRQEAAELEDKLMREGYSTKICP